MNDLLLSTMQNGGWVFSELEPKFRESLLKRFPQASARTTTYLTARHYRQLELPETDETKSLVIVGVSPSQDENEFWAAAVSSLDRDASVEKSDGEWEATVQEALALIGASLPETLTVMQKHISYLCTLKTDTFRSASQPHFFGTLFLKKVSNPAELAVSLIHELGHQELFLINLVDRLIQTGSDFRLAHAPYQGVSRPPIGRLHSAHALYRMIPLEERISPAQAQRHRELLRQTVASFEENEATDFGKRILHEVY